MVRALLSKLRAERSRQRETDRATFAGMFSRGSVCEASKRFVSISNRNVWVEKPFASVL